MECDSMHAAIEHAKRKTNIYIPSQWDTIIHMARRNNPYMVIPLKYWDFIDFKAIQKNFYTNFEKNTEGERVRWREIKYLQFRKDSPKEIFYKYNFDDPDFHVIQCRVNTRGKQKALSDGQNKYNCRLQISSAKKADLLSLCQSGVIPPDCRYFYESLPAGKSVRDRLPEPDIQEDDKDSE